MNENRKIMVTRPLLPDLDEFHSMLKEIWENKILTNNGAFHDRFEKELAAYLGVPYISLFTNGTLPLIVALQALEIKGEVITTPYSFVATSHSLMWNDIRPVFVDISPDDCNMDTDKIEVAITERTTAILPVHCYGYPCNVEKIEKIAQKHRLKVIYDGAHSFGVKIGDKSVFEYGDLSTMSFHATKVFNTVEGGAVISHSPEMKKKIDYLKNFGFAGETEVVGIGINGKLDEIRSAYGLLNLRKIDEAIEWRKMLTTRYRKALQSVRGVSFLTDIKDVRHNYSHFPIFVDACRYGISRDELYQRLKDAGIYSRRYFYPLITQFNPYSSMIKSNELRTAQRMSDQVICLPLYYGLTYEEQDIIINIIKGV